MHYGFLIFTAIHAGLAWLFVAIPEVDLWFSKIFFDPTRGFIGDYRDWESIPLLAWFTASFILSSVTLFIANWLRWRKQPSKSHLLSANRKIIFLLLTLALGPGLFVNTVLKSEFGRARPRDVTEFGGKKSFSPAYVLSRQCRRNCSFVSGDASIGYYLLAFLFIASRRSGARIMAVLGIVMGSGVGLLRVVSGAHFLSDVVFAAFIVVTVAWLLSFVMLRRHDQGQPSLLVTRASLSAKGIARK